MRIISKHSDYYDGIQHQDPDKDLTFVREMVEVKILSKDVFAKQGLIGGRRDPDGYDLLSVIGFCGKLYPFVRLTRYDEWDVMKGQIKTHRIFYEYDEKAMTEFMYPNRKVPKYWNGELYCYKQWFGELEHGRTKWWKTKLNKESTRQIFYDYKVPYFVVGEIEWKDWQILKGWRTGSWEGITITLNPSLKKHEFYRVFDPFTTYQEISMYLGNELADTETKPVPVGDDETLASSKGYDKWSFRQEPGKKKKRKKK